MLELLRVIFRTFVLELWHLIILTITKWGLLHIIFRTFVTE